MSKYQLIVIAMGCFLLSACSGKPILDEAAVGLIEARKAIDEGDNTKAIELLDASIAARPDSWSYYERAKLHAGNGDDDLAKEDIAAGLELDPEHSDLLWLQKQLKKPKSMRKTKQFLFARDLYVHSTRERWIQ